MKKRKVSSILLSLALAASLFTGCGGAEPAAGTETTPDAETEAAETETAPDTEAAAGDSGYKTTGEAYEIHYIARSNEDGTQMQALYEIIDMYQKQVNPNFSMNIECISDQQTHNQKIRTLAASDELPDWWSGDVDSFFYELWNAGMVANMGDIFKELGIYDNFYWCALNYPSTADGEIAGMSWNAQGEYFWYNKDVFEAAGIEKTPETFDELLEICQKIQDSGMTPIGMEGQWRLLRYLAFIPWRLSGNDYIDKLAVGEAKYSDELGIQAAQFIADIGQYFQEGWTTADSSTVMEQLKDGQFGMYYSGTWELPIFSDENGELLDNIGMFQLPLTGEGDVNGFADSFSNGGAPMFISAEAAKEEEMMNFLAFFWDHYNDLCLELGYLPPGQPSNIDIATDLQKELMEDFASVTSYAKCWDVVVDVATSEVLLSETPNLTLGNLTPEEWAARLDEAAAMNIE